MTKIIIKTGDMEPQNQPQEVQPQMEQPKEETIFTQKKVEPALNIELNVRKGLDGRIMIYDHDHIDIVYLPSNKKLVTFCKQDYSDIIYETQSRFFEFFVTNGICSPESVKGGNVYGSLEASVLQPQQKEIPVDQLLLLNIQKWMKGEKPALDMDKEYSKNFTDYLVKPDAEDSTELGEVPHEEEKGTIPKHASRRYIGGWW